MRNDFKILNDLLGRSLSEVSGKELDEPNDEMRGRIERFVRGELKKEERTALCAEIVGQEAALRLLAELIDKSKPGPEKSI